MRRILILLLGTVLSWQGATAEPAVVFELDLSDPGTVAQLEGAEVIRGGGPGGSDALKITGPAAPAIRFDTKKVRGGAVTVEAMVKGEKLGRKFGDCLKLVPDYKPFDKYRENWAYRPAANVPLEKTDWIRVWGTWRIPVFAGDFKLVLGHAGAEGTAWYSNVRILEVPPPEPLAPANAPGVQNVTQYRGAMAGDLKKEEDFRVFAEEWGGNLLRWQFLQGPGSFDSLEHYLAWGREKIAELEKVMPFLEKYNLKVVVDLHRGPGRMNHVNSNLGLWDVDQQETILQLWREIAGRLRGRKCIYGYDLVNEPVDKVYDVRSEALDWNRFAERLAREIRRIDPDTPIIVQPTTMQFSGFRPLNLPNIIYSPHIYEPGEYTHQGIRNRAMVGPYPDDAKGWNKEFLRTLCEPIRAFQKQYNVPIYVGEFGVIRWAPGGERWLDDWISLFEEYGWDWTFHAYREWSGWSVEHSSDKDDETRQATTPRREVILNYFKRNRKGNE